MSQNHMIAYIFFLSSVEIFYSLSCVGFLELQVCVLKQTLSVLDQNYAAQDEKDTC